MRRQARNVVRAMQALERAVEKYRDEAAHAGTCEVCGGAGEVHAHPFKWSPLGRCPACHGHGAQDCSVKVCRKGC